MKTGIGIATFLILFSWGVIAPSFVYAQSPELEEAKEAVDESVRELEQEDSDQIFVLKLRVVENVLRFSEVEIADLLGKHERASQKNSSGLVDIHKEFGERLKSAKSALSDYRDRIEDEDLNLEKLQTLASELKIWRVDQYDPINEVFFDFLLVARIESSMQISEERGRKISKDLDKLEGDIDQEGFLQLRTLFAKAQLELAEAREDQASAKALFRKMITPLLFPELLKEDVSEKKSEERSESLDEESSEAESEGLVEEAETNSSSDAAEGSEETEEEVEDSEILDYDQAKTELNGFLSAALEHIRQAYGNFLKMSSLASSLLKE